MKPKKERGEDLMADTKPAEGIRVVTLKGFKSLLMLKQTLEHSFDPGPLLLDGPHVRFNSAAELFSRSADWTTEDFSGLRTSR